MTIHTRNRMNPTSLSDQIKDAERQVLNRKQKISVDTTSLTRKMREQMTAPTTFLFAGGIGFLLGEITKREPSKSHGTNDKPHAAEVSPLRTALSLVTSIQTLYTALPIAWIINIFNQRSKSSQAPEQSVRRAKADSGSFDRGY